MTTEQIPPHEERHGIFTHIALYWDHDVEQWNLLSIGRSKTEIDASVARWKSKGTEDIRVFEIREL